MNKITFRPEETFESIRRQFRQQFPFLDLQCFKKTHAGQQSFAMNSMLEPETKLASLMTTGKTIAVSFSPVDTVNAFEKKINEISGIYVQVFRKSGKLWLETTVTDGWSLQQQNEEGERSVSGEIEETESPDDHDIY